MTTTRLSADVSEPPVRPAPGAVSSPPREARVSAYQPVSELLAALERAEWTGPGHDARWCAALRTQLRAIGSLLAERPVDDRLGRGEVTHFQIAQRAGVSERTVERNLPELVDLKLVEYTRGMPAVGTRGAVPGAIRVNKRRLVALIRACRKLKDARHAEHRREVRARMLADLRNSRAFWWVRRGRARDRPDTKSGPPFKKEGTAPPGALSARDPVPLRAPLLAVVDGLRPPPQFDQAVAASGERNDAPEDAAAIEERLNARRASLGLPPRSTARPLAPRWRTP